MTAASAKIRMPSRAETVRRPLYLGSAGATVDACEDALVVHLRGRQSIARVPIARVDRVICNGSTDWSGRALVLCLRSAVPVVLLDGRGMTAGWMESASAAIRAADDAVESFVGVTGWRERYDNWLRSRRMDLFCRCVSCGEVGGGNRSPITMAALKRSLVYRTELPEKLPEFAHGWMSAVAIARMEQLGLRGRYIGYGDHILDLAGDLAWLLAAELALSVGNLAGAAVDEAAKLRLFEAQSARLTITAEIHLKSFVYFVRGQARIWH